MDAEPLIHWSDPPRELIGFIAAFLTAGAVGFRFAALRGLFAQPDELNFAHAAARRAARLGFLGAAFGAVLLAQRLPVLAARRHLTVLEFAVAQPPVAVQIILAFVAIVGFIIAMSGRTPGWVLAAIAVLASPFRSALVGQLQRMVNPVHELAGGLWIGTLFVLIAVGVAPALRSPLTADRRGALVARMVNGFSPLALGSAALLATLGVVTAWQHLKRLDALWTTPYGWTLIAKLCVVAFVVALGAWNWRRQKPRLGSESGAVSLRRSATSELALAGVVLVITSVLVSLPTPK